MKARTREHPNGGQGVVFRCPGCNDNHMVRVRVEGGARPSWEWNGNLEAPTFEPSVLVTCNWPLEDGGPEVCHSFVRDGRIQFLGDCTHKLAGQTVELPEITEAAAHD